MCYRAGSQHKVCVCVCISMFPGEVAPLSSGGVFSPHLCVGFLFLVLYPASSSSASAASTPSTLSHTPSHSHNFVTHHLSHSISLTQLCHTPSFSHHLTHIYNFVTRHLSHTISLTHHFLTHHLHTPSFSHHLTHTTLSHTPSHSHNFVTHTIFLTSSHSQKFDTISHHLTHTTLSHTIFLKPSTELRGRRGTWRHPPSFCVAGVALGDWVGSGRGAAPLCVASVALGDIHLHVAWQAWHLLTSNFVSRGSRGTCWHPPSFRVAGVALGALG